MNESLKVALGNIKNEIANKYGKALFDAAKGTNSLDAISKDADSLLEVIKNEDMAVVIHNPLIKKQDKKDIFSEFAKQLNWDKETLNLLFLLIENNRIFAIEDVIGKFLHLMEYQDGTVPVTMVSAHPVTSSLQEQIREDLENKLGKTVKVKNKINPNILGGLQLKIDSLLIDGSIKGKLQRLKNVMKGV